jgi:hypothetical protein
MIKFLIGFVLMLSLTGCADRLAFFVVNHAAGMAIDGARNNHTTESVDGGPSEDYCEMYPDYEEC